LLNLVTNKHADVFGPEQVLLVVVVTAARPAYAGTEGCSILLVFF